MFLYVVRLERLFLKTGSREVRLPIIPVACVVIQASLHQFRKSTCASVFSLTSAGDYNAEMHPEYYLADSVQSQIRTPSLSCSVIYLLNAMTADTHILSQRVHSAEERRVSLARVAFKMQPTVKTSSCQNNLSFRAKKAHLCNFFPLQNKLKP